MSHSTSPTEYRGPDIPRPLGERLETAFGLADRPETFGDWVDAMAAVTDRDGIDVGPDTLCTTDRSPHRARFDGETQHYRCALDTMIVPFIADDVDVVEVRTESPASGAVVEFTVTPAGVDADPAGAVVSFGVAAEVDPPDPGVPGSVLAYEQVCPYGHAFPSRDEYEAWAEAVDAVTMATPIEDALELARALGTVA